MNEKVILIGTGQMAIDYVKVLRAQNIDFIVVGRGLDSAGKFERQTGIIPITGGIKKYLNDAPFSIDTSVIIATGTEALMPTLLTVLKGDAKKVLIEKPAALSIEELLANEDYIKPYADKIFVAYNRRFYSSVIEANRLIEEDGGIQSIHFEFTEWSHKIELLEKAPGIKENWFFANSTHVVDLAFYFGGKPTQWSAYSKGGQLTWHNKVNFSGAGITDKEILFSYISNWESAGRWGIELLTERRRIYLKPMEAISVQLRGSISTTDHAIDASLDTDFKPGLYKQVKAFLSLDINGGLVKIADHIYMTRHVYKKIIS